MMWLVLQNSKPESAWETAEEAVAHIRKVGGWNLWDIYNVNSQGAIKMNLADLLKGK